MFKKERDLAERSKTLLKNKEVRTLRSNILKEFPQVNDDQLNSMITNKAAVTVTKLANKTLLYSIDDIVYFFDLNGRNNLYPTLHFLWYCPNCLTTFIIHSPVSDFLMRGADLMIPGLATNFGLEDLKEGSKACVRVVNNPLPFAVGDSNISWETISDGVRRKGKALSVLHLYGDLLCGKSIPNDGFSLTRIYPTIDCDIPSSEIQYDNDDDNDDDDDDDEGSTAGEGDGVNRLSEDSDGRKGEAETQLPFAEVEVDCKEPSEEVSLSPEEVDKQLKENLILLLKYFIKEQQLPMLVSTFWSMLQRCYIEEENKVDIKKSSFKKVTPFLTFCSGKGLLNMTNENGVASVSKINKNHDWFQEFRVKWTSTTPEDFKSAVLIRMNGEDTNSKEDSTGKGGKNSSKMKVLELHKLPKNYKDIFGTPKGKFGEYLQSVEIRELISNFWQQSKLEDNNDKSKLIIPAENPLFKLAATASKVTAKKSKPTASIPAVKEKDPLPDLSDDELDRVNDELDSAMSLNLPSSNGLVCIAGVWVPEVKSFGTKKEGVDSSWPSLSDANKTDNNLKYSKENDNDGAWKKYEAWSGTDRKGIKGSSSVGGWGFDKGEKWHPISLSTASSGGDKKVKVGKEGRKDEVKKKNKKSAEVVEEINEISIRKDEFFKAFLGKLSPYFAVIASEDSAPIIQSGSPPKVKIIVERRMGNKTVTILRNLAGFALDLASLTKDFQKKFACSVSLSNVPGIPHEKEILLQGPFGLEVEAYLVENCGIPRNLFEVSYGKGTKVPKKK